MPRGKIIVATIVALTISLGSSVIPGAEAAGATAKQATAASFYYCTKASTWTQEPSNWQMKYPFAVGNSYYLFAVTAYGVFNLSVTPSSQYAIVRPTTALSQKLWKKMGCPNGYKTKVWYSYVDSLYNGSGGTD